MKGRSVGTSCFIYCCAPLFRKQVAGWCHTNHDILLGIDCDVGLVGQRALERLIQVQSRIGILDEVCSPATDLCKFLQVFVRQSSVERISRFSINRAKVKAKSCYRAKFATNTSCEDKARQS